MRELLGSSTGSAAPTAAPGDATSVERGRGRPPAPAGAFGAVIVVAVSAAIGLWFVPFIVGLAIGFAVRSRLLFVLLGAAAVASAGWAVPLLWLAVRGEPVAATASSVAALAGLPASAALTLGATIVVAALQAIVGGWLARVIRRPGSPRSG